MKSNIRDTKDIDDLLVSLPKLTSRWWWIRMVTSAIGWGFVLLSLFIPHTLLVIAAAVFLMFGLFAMERSDKFDVIHAILNHFDTNYELTPVRSKAV